VKTASIVLSVVLALAAATPALARPHHRPSPAPSGEIDSGYGPPINWNDIEVSHPEGGG